MTAKKPFLLFVILLAIGLSEGFGQLNEWTWVDGSNRGPEESFYGVDALSPMSRANACTWMDTNNNFWIFAGLSGGTYTLTNDMWTYIPASNTWDWVKGSKQTNNVGYAGEFGVANPHNLPRARDGAISWYDLQGKLWLYGGGVSIGGNSGNSSDLWMFDIASENWTFIKGSQTTNNSPSYGTQGTASTANTPGARQNAMNWIDTNGVLWLFGGASSNSLFRNDLWKFDPASELWTWVSGSSSGNQTGTFGTLGVPSTSNRPGARINAAHWLDDDGNFWLFGGYGYPYTGLGYLNDLWKYSPSSNEWTWLGGDLQANDAGNYGTLNVEDSANYPGSRSGSAFFADSTGDFWLFGGYGYITTSAGTLNDIWKYNPSTNYWTWMGGTTELNENSTHGIKSIPSVSNAIGGRYLSSGWCDPQGDFWIFGGTEASGTFGDLWRYDPSNQIWTWMKGSEFSGNLGYYSNYPSSILTTPGSRSNMGSWTTSDGRQWLYGGSHYISNSPFYHNDLWQFNSLTNEWTFLKGGVTSNETGQYGNLGTESATSQPGAREVTVCWTDSTDNIWLFGGLGFNSSSSSLRPLNDFWKFNTLTQNWTWVRGTSSGGAANSYGTQGLASSANVISSRYGSMSWTDSLGMVWIFGGSELNTVDIYKSDLWKFNPYTNELTWMKGPTSTNVAGSYGTQGTANTSNCPGGRKFGNTWVDANGNFWLFGGYGKGQSAASNGYLNDLWKYEPSTNMWTWIKGTTALNSHRTSVGIEIGDPTNNPGSRYGASSWADLAGNLWLFGGIGFDTTIWVNSFNDLWYFDVDSNYWIATHLEAPDEVCEFGITTPNNRPLSTVGACSWFKNDSAWIYGGLFPSSGKNDAYVYSVDSNTWTWVAGNGIEISAVYESPQEHTHIGARVNSATWSDISGNLWLFGGSSQGLIFQDIWRYNIFENQWHWVKGSPDVDQLGTIDTNFYPPSKLNPGGRANPAFWQLSDGSFWMYGGYGKGKLYTGYTTYGSFSDLWKYDPASNIWSIIKGNLYLEDTAHFGSLGIPDSANHPGAKEYPATWVDSNGVAWLFGGRTQNSLISNDLWTYNSSSNNWTWMGGSDSIFPYRHYGTLGISNAMNHPGPRSESATWVDTLGNLWLFGGFGSSTSLYSQGILNDLWKYDPITSEWTWMKGSNQLNHNGNYESIGVPSSTAYPSCRSGAAFWTDSDGIFWLLGGKTDPPSNFSNAMAHDLWSFNPYTNQWTWIGGDWQPNKKGIYGIKGSSSATNFPGSRSIAQYWTDFSGNLWLFGGYGNDIYTTGTNYNRLSDLWKYKLTNCNLGISVMNIQHVNCYGDSNAWIKVSGLGGEGSLSYLWSNGQTQDSIFNLTAGFYTVTVTDSLNCLASISIPIQQPNSSLTANILTTDLMCFNDSGGMAVVVPNGGSAPYNFIWNTGSVLDSIQSLAAGYYAVTVIDNHDCETSDSAFVGQPEMLSLEYIIDTVICNYDSNGMIEIIVSGGTNPYEFSWATGDSNYSISDLSQGVYFLTVTDSNACMISDSIEMMALSHLSTIIDTNDLIDCNGDTNAHLVLHGNNGVAPYEYSWNTGATGNSVYVGAGVYTVTVTDALLCFKVREFVKTQPSLLIVSLNASNETCEGLSNGIITSQVTGGTSPYMYQWSHGFQHTNANAFNLAPGYYTLTVTDIKGCAKILTDTVHAGFPNPNVDLGPDTTVLNGQPLMLNPGIFNQYNWQNGSTDPTFTASLTGIYWVLVTDSNGCFATDTAFITIWPLGFKQTVVGQITLYPNPTVGEITILNTVNFNGNVESVIMNALGETVLYFNTPVLDKSFKLDLGALAKGSYFLTIKAGDQARVFNIILM